MDSWEWNKILGAVLGTLLFVMVIRIGADALYEPQTPAKPGYVVAGVAATASSGAASSAPAAEPIPDWGTVLPTASVSSGATVAHACEQCHDISKGGPNKIGPELWNVVNRPRATEPGYDYSSAMSSNHDPWTFDKLFVYLKSPQAMVPGTKMTFAGIRSAQQRINLLAYLRTEADKPAPIPAPAAKAAPAATKAAAPATKATPAKNKK